MKISLKSDFWDYYDQWFDSNYGDGLVFERISTGGMSRQEMFRFFEKIGLAVPVHGTVKTIVTSFEKLIDDPGLNEKLFNMEEIVVYTDTQSHRGEGKIKIKRAEALEKYPDHFCSEHITASPTGHGVSYRFLQVGKRVFWLRYTSRDDWRSNCGDVVIDFLGEEKSRYHPKISYPLFAVDFIFAGKAYAIDLNIAPQIRGTGIEGVLPAKEAAEQIMQAIPGNKNLQTN